MRGEEGNHPSRKTSKKRIIQEDEKNIERKPEREIVRDSKIHPVPDTEAPQDGIEKTRQKRSSGGGPFEEEKKGTQGDPRCARPREGRERNSVKDSTENEESAVLKSFPSNRHGQCLPLLQG